MDQRTGPRGEPLWVDRTATEIGSKGPFYVVYDGPDGETRWGFLCSNCDSMDNAVDTMGRIRCNVCSNLHKAEEWDAAHE